ncbi:MAG: MFS transporter [Promethearchaeota archaeon]
MEKSSPNMFLYALPKIATSMLMGFADFALLFLYGVVFSLSGVYVGIALFLGKISISILQFVFGWVSDHFPYLNKLGRRKPFLIFFSPFLVLSFLFLVMPGPFLGSNPSEIQLFLWFAIWNMSFQGLYGIHSPYQAWLAELFHIEERPKVSAVQNIFVIIGTAIMLIFSMLVLTDVQEELKENVAAVPIEFSSAVIIFSLMVVAFFYICAYKLPVEKKQEIKTTLLKDFKALLHDHNFLHFSILVGLTSLAWIIVNQYLLPLAEVILGLDFIGYALLAVIMVLVLIVSIMGWRKSIHKNGKDTTLHWIYLLSIVVLPFSLVPMLSLPSPFIFGAIYIPCVAIGLGGWTFFPYVIYADLAEHEAKKGKSALKAGLYAGFPFLPLNVFQAIGLFIAGILLELPTYPFQTGLKSLGFVVWGPICSFFFIITYFYKKKFVRLDLENGNS